MRRDLGHRTCRRDKPGRLRQGARLAESELTVAFYGRRYSHQCSGRIDISIDICIGVARTCVVAETYILRVAPQTNHIDDDMIGCQFLVSILRECGDEYDLTVNA